MSILNESYETDITSPLGDGRYDLLMLSISPRLKSYEILQSIFKLGVPSVPVKDFADYVSREIGQIVWDQAINQLSFDSNYHSIHYESTSGEVFNVLINNKKWLSILISEQH